jgi:ribosomal protein S18 acetylase RimI-like enzyme
MTDADRPLRPATAADAEAVARLVDDAYGHWVERIGMVPGPMTEDYANVIAKRRVMVAEIDERIVGVIVFGAADAGFAILNVAVHPSFQGKGLGRALMEHAESAALRGGFDSVYLYTHEKATENIALYAKVGYVEYERRSMGDFALVFMRKRLG